MAPGNQQGTGRGVNYPYHIGPSFDERLRVIDERLEKGFHQIFYELWVLINVSHESGQAPEHVSFSPRGIDPCDDMYIGAYSCPQFSGHFQAVRKSSILFNIHWLQFLHIRRRIYNCFKNIWSIIVRYVQ